MRVENEKAREWYMDKAADPNWSTRQLDRQVFVFYYERILGMLRTRTKLINQKYSKIKIIEHTICQWGFTSLFCNN